MRGVSNLQFFPRYSLLKWEPALSSVAASSQVSVSGSPIENSVVESSAVAASTTIFSLRENAAQYREIFGYGVRYLLYLGTVVIAFYITVPAGRLRLLRFLLCHRSWLSRDSGASGLPRTSSDFEARKKIYLGLTWMLGGRNPKLFSLQDALPLLPVPRLEDTCSRYLRSVRQVLSESDFRRTNAAVLKFLAPGGEGWKLQEKLLASARKQKCWLTDVLDRAWLGERRPLPVHCNWYGVDRADTPRVTQSERVAAIVRGALKFRMLIQTQQLCPLRLAGAVPLCMDQYSHLFGTTRIPGVGHDGVVSNPSSDHIVIIIKGQFYVVNLVHPNGRWLSLVETQSQVQEILDLEEDGSDHQQPLVGMLTSENRAEWARARQALISHSPVNKKSLHDIETALICLTLEGDAPATLDGLARETLLGNPHSRWYDKSIQMMVFKNAVASCTSEQSRVDAAVLSHLFGFMHDVEDCYYNTFQTRGANIPAPPRIPPRKLKWEVPDVVIKAISDAEVHFHALTDDIGMHVSQFPHFGKSFIKELRLSPDAFIQLALQLAYYRSHKKLPYTLELAHTRQFRGGRTEHVRCLSDDTVAFVLAHEQLAPSANETKVHLLVQACAAHAHAVRDAMNGDGCDRHLLALSVLAQNASMDIPMFSDPAFNSTCQLYTAQAPVQRGPGGGLGLPNLNDGVYAVSYLVKDDNLYFHITCRTVPGVSNAVSLGQAIDQALLDMQALCNQHARLSRCFSERALDILG
mmetsp:Transcript_28933/g.66951  ORF Transcript_28933/g.66951 Transcript_28933/m.66951 type:complete len:748 (+) Transcript_28933:57-2300(+)